MNNYPSAEQHTNPQRGKGRSVTRDMLSLMTPEGGVEFPRAESRDANRSVTIVIKKGTKITTGLHWHEHKTEFLQVIQGHALVTIGDRTDVFGPEDGIVTIPRLAIHEYGRADGTERGAASRGEDLVVREWVDPPDGDKEVFFRNMTSSILDHGAGVLGTAGLVVGLFTIMQAHDNYPLFIRGPSFMGPKVQLGVRRAVTRSVLAAMSSLGWLLGYKGTYVEYTPDDGLEMAKRR